VLLAKNSDDIRLARGKPPAAGSLGAITIVAGILILIALVAIIFWSLGRGQK